MPILEERADKILKGIRVKPGDVTLIHVLIHDEPQILSSSNR
jgi:hypothetical protein